MARTANGEGTIVTRADSRWSKEVNYDDNRETRPRGLRAVRGHRAPSTGQLNGTRRPEASSPATGSIITRGRKSSPAPVDTGRSPEGESRADHRPQPLGSGSTSAHRR